MKRVRNLFDALMAAFLGLSFIVAVGLVCSKAKPIEEVESYRQFTITQAELKYDIEILTPTFLEFQQLLLLRGYECQIDGVIGKDTIAAWDRAICDRQASKHYEPAELQELIEGERK